MLYRLKKGGYGAFLVGGCVRDLLLRHKPKDFDVATDASPEQVKELFRNCRLIGRRFRLAHVHFGREIIEVATFRGQSKSDDSEDGQLSDEGRILRDNVFGSQEEDAWRRDFTVNALYYDISNFSVIDYVGGLKDLKEGQLKLIGDPVVRYKEDAVRMLRAIRFAAKLGFKVHEGSEKPIAELGQLLVDIPESRLYEEVLKLFLSGNAEKTLQLLRQYNLLHWLFPMSRDCLDKDSDCERFVNHVMACTDARVAEGKPVMPGFLFAAFLWHPLQQSWQLKNDRGEAGFSAWQTSASEVLQRQRQQVSLPKRVSAIIRDIWRLQPRFERLGGKRPFRLLANPRFRAAYDFLLMRGVCDPEIKSLAGWWTEFQVVDGSTKQKMINAAKRKEKRSRKKAKISNPET